MKRLAYENLQRNRTGAISCFLALALGTLLINLIPQIYQGLQEEVSRPDDFRIPSLFLFDIQQEQMETLKKTLISEKVNVKNFVYSDKVALTREQERQQSFRRRNL